MEYLVDSNILGRYADASSAQHTETKNALSDLTNQGSVPVLVPQNIYEFTSFASRPISKNGLGLSKLRIDELIEEFLGIFVLKFPDPEEEVGYFRRMYLRLNIQNKQVHDLRLAAACRSLTIVNLLTYNLADFAEVEQAGYLKAVSPAQVVATPPPQP
jgi:predicted nucleic acid-binding protein